MFDFAVFASWPRGLYLSKQLSEKGYRVAYIDILPRRKNPFGLLFDESSEDIKFFLKAIGFLTPQKGGVCLLTSQGVWPLQEMKPIADRHVVLKNKLNNIQWNHFTDHWLSYLSLNLAGKVFEYNNSEFSDKNLNFFSDYFTFQEDVRKIKLFKTNHPGISFYNCFSEDISFDDKSLVFNIKEESVPAERYFWLKEYTGPPFKNKEVFRPQWVWSSFFFKIDLGGYEEILPHHFLSLKDLFLPWTHDNLLSVFLRQGKIEVWIRTAYGKNKQLFLKRVKEHLEFFFPGGLFFPIKDRFSTGPVIFGKNSLKNFIPSFKDKVYIENRKDFFQLDLASEIQAERKLSRPL